MLSSAICASTKRSGEVFDATPGKHCDHCQFHSVCPTKAAGTVLS